MHQIISGGGAVIIQDKIPLINLQKSNTGLQGIQEYPD
jgi:hypothetical protein